jgi:Flp pilus assembly protein TadD
MRRIIALLLLVSALLVACRSGAGVDPEHDDTEESSLTAVAQEAAELVNEGKALLEDDRCQAAVEPLERSIELQPDLPDAYLALGNAHARLGRVGDAIDAYRQALEVDEEFAAAHTNLGAAYLRQIDSAADSDTTAGQVQKAIDSFRTALELEPEDAETHANLGSALLQASQMSEARDEFEEALRLDPNLAEARVGMGYLYLLTGQAQEAVTYLEKAAELAADMPEAQYALGIAYAETSQLAKAIAAFEAFLAIEIPAECAGDVAAAAEARAQAAALLDQLRTQQ